MTYEQIYRHAQTRRENSDINLNNLLKIVSLQGIRKVSGEQVKRDFATKKMLRKPGENKRSLVLEGHTRAGEETKVDIEQKVSPDQLPDLRGGRKVIVWE